MSRFCGKCDFYDHIEIFGDDEDTVKKTRVYLHGEEVDCSTEKNRALYYPYIVGIMASNRDGCVIHLSSMSYIRQEELENLEFVLKDVLAGYRRCKRNKIPFTFKNATAKMYSWYLSDAWIEQTKEIYERVNKLGNKATVDDMNADTNMGRYYRHEWYDELVRLGWDEDFAKKWVKEK